MPPVKKKKTTTKKTETKKKPEVGKVQETEDLKKAKKVKEREIVYESVDAGVKTINEEMMMDMLGATIAPLDKPFLSPLFRLPDGRTVVCSFNTKNRPFSYPEAERLAYVILSDQWVLNGEPIILSNYGEIIDGQHRLCALMIAIALFRANPDDYKEYWSEEPTIDSVIVVGVSEDPKVVNTLNTGRRRRLSDALVCAGLVNAGSAKETKLQAKTLENMMKFVTQRISYEHDSLNKKRVYADDVEFFTAHQRMLRSVEFCIKAQGKGKQLTTACGINSLGIVSGLHYFMATCLTDAKKYENKLSEEAVDFSAREKADEFIASMANGEKLFEPLRRRVGQIFKENPYAQYHEAMQLIIQAWHQFAETDKIDVNKLKLKYSKPDEDGFRLCTTEEYIGGLDYPREEL